jgi:hypothetical protein
MILSLSLSNEIGTLLTMFFSNGKIMEEKTREYWRKLPMSLVINLPKPVETRLQAEATRTGVTSSEYVADLVTKNLPSEEPEEDKTHALLQSWLEQARQPRTPEEDAEAEADMLELMRNMNATRVRRTIAVS